MAVDFAGVLMGGTVDVDLMLKILMGVVGMGLRVGSLRKVEELKKKCFVHVDMLINRLNN